MHAEPPRKPPPPTPKVLALGALATIVIETFFPWLRRFDWTRRLGPRGWAVHIALQASVIMGMDRLTRTIARSVRERADLEARLRKELGRAPWPEEIERAWHEDRLR
jgi:hypothetical protein